MDMRTVFPSRFLRVEDLNPGGTKFTIGNVAMEQVLAEWKPVMWFKGFEKGLVLNQTNGKILSALPGWGPESNHWVGKEIILFTFMAMQNGQPQARIGVREPGPQDGAVQAAPAWQPPDYSQSQQHPANQPQQGVQGGAPQPGQQMRPPFNDEIPF